MPGTRGFKISCTTLSQLHIINSKALKGHKSLRVRLDMGLYLCARVCCMNIVSQLYPPNRQPKIPELRETLSCREDFPRDGALRPTPYILLLQVHYVIDALNGFDVVNSFLFTNNYLWSVQAFLCLTHEQHQMTSNHYGLYHCIMEWVE